MTFGEEVEGPKLPVHNPKSFAYPKYMKENQVDLVIFVTAFPNFWEKDDPKYIARMLVGL